jgi:hypothetical protein
MLSISARVSIAVCDIVFPFSQEWGLFFAGVPGAVVLRERECGASTL